MRVLFLAAALAFLPCQSGAQWVVTNGPDFGPLSTLQGLGMNGGTLFAGTGFEMDPGIFDGWVHRTTDNGNTWEEVGGGWEGFVVGFGFHNGDVFAGTEVGVFRSTNNGGTWTRASTGLSGGWFRTFVVCENALFTAGHAGVFRSTNRGSAWQTVETGAADGVGDLAARERTIVATTFNGVMRSTDAGAHWTMLSGGLPAGGAGAVVWNGAVLLAATGETVYRSTDNGDHWAPAGNGLPAGGAGDLAAVRGVVFAATPAGVFRTQNNGDSWAAVSEGLAGVAPGMLACNGSTLFAATSRETYRRPLSEMGVVSNTVGNPGFEAGTPPWRFFTDGSGTMSAVPDPGAVGSNVASVAITVPGTNVQMYQAGIPLDPRTAYRLRFRAFSNRGHDLSVYVARHTAPYTNCGLAGKVFNLTTVWQQFSTTFVTKGFTEPVQNARLRFWFAPFDAAGDRFFVDDVVLEAVPPAGRGQDPAIVRGEVPVQAFPNPFNPSTSVLFRLAEPASVSLHIYDLLGRRVAELAGGEHPAGDHRVVWDAGGMAGGVYFVRLTSAAPGGTVSRTVTRLLLIK